MANQKFRKMLLSGSTNGRNVKIAATATAGTLIHTAHATDLDELYLFANNTSDAEVTLTIEFGGVTSPDDHIIIKIPPKAGEFQICAERLLTNSLVVRAFASVADVVNVGGYVHRITG